MTTPQCKTQDEITIPCSFSLIPKELHAHLHSLDTWGERRIWARQLCVEGNKDFLFQKLKVECSGPLFYPHSVRQISSRGYNMAYNVLEFFSCTKSILLAEEY